MDNPGAETSPKCAYEKIRTGIIGNVACDMAGCHIDLFTRNADEEPVNLSTNFKCGSLIFPVGTMEQQPVEIRRDTVGGRVRIFYRDELRPVAE